MFALALLIAAQAAPGSAPYGNEHAFRVFGIGATSCAAAYANPDAEAMSEAWVLGYFTALNTHNVPGVGRTVNAEGVLASVRKACFQTPRHRWIEPPSGSTPSCRASAGKSRGDDPALRARHPRPNPPIGRMTHSPPGSRHCAFPRPESRRRFQKCDILVTLRPGRRPSNPSQSPPNGLFTIKTQGNSRAPKRAQSLLFSGHRGRNTMPLRSFDIRLQASDRPNPLIRLCSHFKTYGKPGSTRALQGDEHFQALRQTFCAVVACVMPFHTSIWPHPPPDGRGAVCRDKIKRFRELTQ
jgi:hypothetical protein